MKNRSPLVIVFITVFVDLVGFGLIIPLSPYLAKEYGADAFQVGLLMSIYSLMQFLFAPFWGQWSDKIGRRPIILLSLLGASLSHLLFALSDTLVMLFVARALAGLFGANISTAMAYIADVTNEKDRSKNMGLIGAAFGLGFMLGPFLGGITGDMGQWLAPGSTLAQSFPALLASLICFANFLAAFKFLPESRAKRVEGGYQQNKPRVRYLLRHFQKPVVGHLMLVFFLFTFGMAHVEAALFLYVHDLFNWSLTQASFGFAYVGVVMIFTQGYLIRKLLPKVGERKLLVTGLIVAGTGLSGIGFSSTVPMMAFFVTCLGLGVGFVNPSINGCLSLLTSADEQGSVMGANQSLAALARILGPALGGWVYRDVSMESPFYVAGTLAFVGLMVVLPLISRLPQKGLSPNG